VGGRAEEGDTRILGQVRTGEVAGGIRIIDGEDAGGWRRLMLGY
jgi:hypothetical protein